jgi:hypothetical protein
MVKCSKAGVRRLETASFLVCFKLARFPLTSSGGISSAHKLRNINPLYGLSELALGQNAIPLAEHLCRHLHNSTAS